MIYGILYSIGILISIIIMRIVWSNRSQEDMIAYFGLSIFWPIILILWIINESVGRIKGEF